MSRPLRLSVCIFNELASPKAKGVEPARIEAAMALAEQARREGADLACFAETALIRGLPGAMTDYAEPLDGPVWSQIAAAAKRLGIFIMANHPTMIDGEAYNTCALFNRRGQLDGFYNKAYPTITELEWGIRPGDGAVCLDTEIGRIGFAICFDLNYCELRRRYAELRPDVILFSSYYRGGLQCNFWAFETHAHFASAVIDPCSQIINPLGRMLNWTDGRRDRVLTQTIELDCRVLHYDYNVTKLKQLRDKWGQHIDIELDQPAGVFLLTARGGHSVDEIIDDVGLERVEDYFDRCRKAIHQVRQTGQSPAPGPAAWTPVNW